MRTDRKFKTIGTKQCEDYLHQIINTRHRMTLTKLRLSNHKLTIETDRYLRSYKKPEERMCLDLFGCSLRKHGERVGLCRQIRETFIFSCISFPITEQYFWGLRPDFSANIFFTLSRLQTIYFVFLDPQKKFFKISHSSVQKNNGPSFTMFLPCSKSINSLPGSFNYKNIFFSRKIAFFILSKFLSTLCY